MTASVLDVIRTFAGENVAGRVPARLGSVDGLPDRLGSDPLVFHALTYDPDTFAMLGVKSGTGDGTQGRDSARYALNIEDLYFSVAAYEAAWYGGRNVQNEATFSEDLTNAAWDKTNGTATASIFTATSGNATCLQTLTKAASDRIYACTIGRVTGTGTVEITTDGGTTWVDITTSVEATTKRFTCNKSAETDPEYGIRLVTSGDEVSFTYHQNEDATGRADLTTPSEYCPADTAAGPELYTELNAAEGGENSLTGIDQNGLDAGANVFESQNTVTPSTSYAVHVNSNDTPTAAAGMSIDLGTVLGLEGGDSVLLTVKARHNGTGSKWRIYLANSAPFGTSHPITNSEGLSDIDPADIIFEEFSISYVYDSTYRYLIAREYNPSNNGGVYLSDLSVTKATTGYKVFATQNGNTVASNVVTEAAGAALTEAPWLSGCPAATNAQIRSNDLADAEWTASNMTAGDQDETGIDGNPASACTLTATAGNATLIANALTAASDTHATAWHIKRKTGTGTIELTLDNGSTWQDITSDIDADFTRIAVDQAALTNPQIGIRLVTDTDAVIVGNAEAHTAKPIAEVRGLPPIFTEGAAVSTTADEESLDILNHSQTRGAYYFEIRPSFATSEVSGDLQLLSLDGSADLSYYDGTNGDVESTDGANTATQAQALVAGTAYKIGIAYGDSKLRVCVDGSWGTEQTYDGAFASGAALELFNALAYAAEMRDLRRYDLTYSAAKDKIDELMIT